MRVCILADRNGLLRWTGTGSNLSGNRVNRDLNNYFRLAGDLPSDHAILHCECNRICQQLAEPLKLYLFSV
jgi:hypothetical protein